MIICSNKNNAYSVFNVTQNDIVTIDRSINIKNIKITILFDISLLIRYINFSYNKIYPLK